MKTVAFGFAALVAVCAMAQDFMPAHATIERGTLDGRQAVHLVATTKDLNEDMLATLQASAFRDGVIEVDVAGKPRSDAPADARGFIGVAFRVRPQATAYECIYVRPTNGRADDQLRRN